MANTACATFEASTPTSTRRFTVYTAFTILTATALVVVAALIAAAAAGKLARLDGASYPAALTRAATAFAAVLTLAAATAAALAPYFT
ncbi:hypothetical protein [Kitasatospora sp. NPDC059327]|uniref:hypothetical protein n=1 Tax=Kitasatospora sp. NPDC059327 TaxID=3346803 RepID=UPI0036AF6D21